MLFDLHCFADSGSRYMYNIKATFKKTTDDDDDDDDDDVINTTVNVAYLYNVTTSHDDRTVSWCPSVRLVDRTSQ